VRDLILVLSFFALIPFVLKRPYIGACLMASVGFLNPQTLTWSFARSVPFAALAVFFTLVAMLTSKDKKRFVTNPTFIFVYVFVLWGAITTLNAFFPEDALIELSRFLKIQVSIFITVLLITERKHLIALVWTIALSLGFWGVKGGIFSILTGGGHRVWGARGTFIGGNNEIGLALLMDIPLLYYLYISSQNKWVKRGLLASIGFCLIAIIFTYSRGAFLGLCAMSFFLWMKSDKKLILGVVAMLAVVIAIPFIPASVGERLSTIESYDEDQSALGRINAWQTAFNMANDRITGGGYRHTSELTFALYSPHPEGVHDAHSIYFEVLGETGWIGLILFFLIHLTNWFAAKKIISKNKKIVENKWAVDLAKMVQVSLIAYYSGGAFLGLAYWDLPYYLMVIILLMSVILNEKKTI